MIKNISFSKSENQGWDIFRKTNKEVQNSILLLLLGEEYYQTISYLDNNVPYDRPCIKKKKQKTTWLIHLYISQ